MFSEVLELIARRVAPAALVLAAALPASADAATFHHWGCRTPTGAVAPADGWAADGGTPAAAVQSNCEAGGAVGVIAGNASGAASASMTYSPGAQLTATAATLWRAARAVQSHPTHAPDFPLAMYAMSASFPQDSLGNPYYYGMEIGFGDGNTADNQPDDTIVGTTAEPLAAANRVELSPLTQGFPHAPIKLEGMCNAWTGQYACDARYLLTAYDVTLRDDSAPVVGAVGGSLVNASGAIDPSAAVSGSRNVIVLGTDTGSGLYRTVIEVDGQEAASSRTGTADARCNPAPAADGTRAYVVRQPCPLSGSATVSWDTTKVGDGSHHVRVLLEDASGNRTVVTQGNVAVKNTPPPTPPKPPTAPGATPTTPGAALTREIGPESPLEIRGDVNGSVAAEAATLTLNWPGTARAASKKAAVIRRCKQAAWAAKHVIDCQGRAAQSSVVTSWSATKTVAIAGRLTDPGGTPIVGATVILIGTPAAVGAGPAPLATVTTDATGAFQAAVPRAAGSQTVAAQWRSRAADTKPAAAASATITVKAATALSAPRTVKRRSRVTFRGALLGKAGLLEKVPVRLQVQDGRRWWTFATASTDAAGKWKTTAKFANRPGTYTVRAKIDAATTYPFAAGGSQQSVRIRVR